MDISERLGKFLNDENGTALASVLKHSDRLFAELATKSTTIGATVENFETVSATLNQTAAAARDLIDRLDPVAAKAHRALGTAGGSLDKIDRVIDAEVSPALRELRQTAKSFAQVSEDLRKLIADNRDSVSDFSGAGLTELGRFIGEARQLVGSIDRLSQRLESDPGQFLFGDAQRGYKPR